MWINSCQYGNRPSKPNEKEMEASIINAQSKFLAMGLLLHSDPWHYASMVCDIENQYTYGRTSTPLHMTTLSTAKDTTRQSTLTMEPLNVQSCWKCQ